MNPPSVKTRPSLSLLFACLGGLLGACAPAPAEVADLAALVKVGNHAQALVLSEELEARGIPRERLRPYTVLASAGLGDCGPAEELLDDAHSGLSDRRVAAIASEAAYLSVVEMLELDMPFLWQGVSLLNPEIVAWNSRLATSVCVLEEARNRFPASGDIINARIAEVQSHRIDAEALSHEMSVEEYDRITKAFRVFQCYDVPPGKP